MRSAARSIVDLVNATGKSSCRERPPAAWRRAAASNHCARPERRKNRREVLERQSFSAVDFTSV
jgi:hypothetical protein